MVSEKWKKGTGGGPGSPVNYENWQDRDDELFANYDQSRGKHSMAWLYMVDKNIGFLLDAKNYPVSVDVQLEDRETPVSDISRHLDFGTTKPSPKCKSNDVIFMR